LRSREGAAGNALDAGVPRQLRRCLVRQPLSAREPGRATSTSSSLRRGYAGFTLIWSLIMGIPTATNRSEAASSSASKWKPTNTALALSFALEIVQPSLNAFTVVGLRGTEGISQLFRYELDLVADRAKPVAFQEILGQPVDIYIPMGEEFGPADTRRFSGIIS